MNGSEAIILKKRLGAFEVFTISTGTMIGAGIFVLPGIIFSKSGPSSILCFVAASLIAGCTALSASELATGMPKSGGDYYSVSRAMGPMFGSIVGWGSILGLAFKGGFAFLGAGDYFGTLVDVNPIVTALALCALLMAVNTVGTGATTRFQNLIVVFMSAGFVLFIAEGFFSTRLYRYTPFFEGGAFTFIEVTGMVFITYLGLIKATAVSEEVRNPARDLPLGMISSLVFVTALYVMVMVVTIGVVPMGELRATVTPIADAASSFGGQGALIFMVVCGLLATISTGNAALLSSSRYPLAMARDRLLPGSFASLNPRLKTPSNSILAVGLLMLALIALFDLDSIVKLGSTFNLMVFAMLNSSVIILRRASPDWYKPGFKSPLYPIVQIIGILGSLLLIPFMGVASWVGALLLLVIGVLWYLAYARGEALPGYGLRDALRTLQDKKAADLALASYDHSSHHSWRLLVPLLSEKASPQLLEIAGYLAEHFEEKAHLAFCNVLPEQALVTYPVAGSIECVSPSQCADILDSSTADLFEFDELYACSMDIGYVEMAKDYGIDLALVEWPPDMHRASWEIRRMIRDMPCDTAFLFSKTYRPLKRILVASALPEDKLKLTIAGAIASQTDSSVTVARVYHPKSKEMGPGDLKERILKSGLLYGVPVEALVLLEGSVHDTLVGLSNDFDLVIMGSSPADRVYSSPFGAVVDGFVLESACSVLVTRPIRPARRSIPSRFAGKLIGRY